MANYFTIHKNKKPKRLFQKRFNPYNSLFLITAAMGALQLSTIHAQPIPKYKELDLGVDERFNVFNNKVKQLGESALGTAIAILRLTRQQQLYRFKTTGNYGRNKCLRFIKQYEKQQHEHEQQLSQLMNGKGTPVNVIGVQCGYANENLYKEILSNK